MTESSQLPATPAPRSPSPQRKGGGLPSVYRSMASGRTGTRAMRRLTAWADRMAVPLDSPLTPQTAPSPDVLAARTIRIGWLASLVMFGLIGGWMGLWPLATGAVATGKVVLDTNRKTLQHLEGGIVKEILVKEGDTVEQGQVVLRLDPTNTQARRDSQRSQYVGARATEARLIAERDALEEVRFPDDLTDAAEHNPEIASQLDTQRRLFATRRANLREQMEVLQQRIAQSEDQIRGLKEQAASASEQLRLLKEETAMVAALVQSGNAVKSRLLALQRSSAQLQGQRGQAVAGIAQVGQQIAQAKTEIANQKTAFLKDVMAELKDAQVQASALEEQLRTSQDMFQRIEITSPQAGKVVGLKVHTVGGVVRPGEPLMDIVPTGEKLVVEAQVNPQDIDNVQPGLPARVRLTAYKQRRVHPVAGTVVTVSADRFDDPQRGTAYYTARVEIPASEFAELKGVELTPGMPAEVLIVTGHRTLLSYLIDPIRYSFGKAFREE